MPWLKEVPYNKNHVCKLPDKQARGVGSVWECDECGATYRIEQKFMGTQRRWRCLSGAKPTPYNTPRPPALKRASSSDADPNLGGKTTELSSDETPSPQVTVPPHVRIGKTTDDGHPVFGAITMHEKRTAELMDMEVHSIISEREFLGYKPLDVPVYLKD